MTHLLGMANTLRLRTAISPSQWQPWTGVSFLIGLMSMAKPSNSFIVYLDCKYISPCKVHLGTFWRMRYRAVFNWVSKVITQLLWFCIATVCDWLKNFAPLSQPIRSKTKTNRDLLARVFPRLARATCICFELWLVHWIVYDCCDWSE